MSLNLPLVIREYVLKMMHEASVGMKALILDDFTMAGLYELNAVDPQLEKRPASTGGGVVCACARRTSTMYYRVFADDAR